ncbi:MAG: ferritin [Pseudomonadota bacterium]
MSTAKTVDALNDLLNGELRAFHLYMSSSAWCAMNHLNGAREFFSKHASEELTHFSKIFEYLVEIDAPIRLAALPEPSISVNGVEQLIGQVSDHEAQVTRAVAEAVELARSEGDHSAFEFLQWFVAEQREEENLFREIRDCMAVIGDGPHKLYFLDKELEKFAKS